jgi:hypothetical protein
LKNPPSLQPGNATDVVLTGMGGVSNKSMVRKVIAHRNVIHIRSNISLDKKMVA